MQEKTWPQFYLFIIRGVNKLGEQQPVINIVKSFIKVDETSENMTAMLSIIVNCLLENMRAY